MTNKDDTAPAKKADIKAIMDSIGELYDANQRWKDEILEETKRHFDVTVEQIRHDLEGANKDKIEVLDDAKVEHDQRITHLEQVVGVRGR